MDPAGSVAASIAAMADLLTDVPHVMFCVKDAAGIYVAANQAFADRAGRRNPADVIGWRARDLFPAELADSYEQQDLSLLATGRPLRNQIELILRPDGSVGWYVTSKTLLGDPDAPAAIAVISVDLRAPAETAAGGVHAAVARAIEFARAHPTDTIGVAELAAAAALSPSQLERALRRTIGVSAKQLVIRLRLESAMHRLRTTDDPIAVIAGDCGYYDQSAFARQFKKLVRMSPGAYRASLPRR